MSRAKSRMLDAIVAQLNDHAERNEGFWLAGLARETAQALLAANRLQELTPSAREAVNHYLRGKHDNQNDAG